MEVAKKHARLGWRILECKLMYYHSVFVDKKYHKKLEISDAEFDALSREYLTLCLDNGFENSVCHENAGLRISEDKWNEITKINTMEVDFNRPSVKLIILKYGSDRGLERIGLKRCTT